MSDSERLARRWFEEVWNRRNERAIGELMDAGCIGVSVVGRALRRRLTAVPAVSAVC